MLRHIQDRVTQKQRWIVLLASGTAWFVLWLVSAAIFKRTETRQNWSYFQALYFTFISLMTIGYGDLYPTSNAGKPLFVFWSLLAVPTITILVSSMGDTIIKKAKDYSRWLANRVQYTGESSKRNGLSYFLGTAIGKKTSGAEHRVSSTQNSFSTRQRSSDLIKGKVRDELRQPSAGIDKESTIYCLKDSMETGSVRGKDLPHYHYQLIKEISKVTEYLLTSPLRQYTYNEWTRFHALTSRGEHSGISRVDLADEAEGAGSRDVSELESHGESASDGVENEGYLRSSISESQWMLEHLIMTLKRELKSQVEEG
jgi:potassium channel subfamily K